MNKTSIRVGSIVVGTFQKVLPSREQGSKPKNVLIKLTHTIGQVDETDQMSLFPTPVAVSGNIVGKEFVGNFPGDTIESRDELMGALLEVDTAGELKTVDPVTLEVLDVQTVQGRLHIELSEVAYLRRKSRGGLKVGDTVKVRVTDTSKPYGVFVSLTPDEDALLHRSEQLRGVLKIGDEIEVVVIEKRESEKKGGKLRWGVSQLAIQRKAKEQQEAARAAKLQQEQEAEVARQVKQKERIAELKVYVAPQEAEEGKPAVEEQLATHGTATVRRDRGDALIVLLDGTFECVLPNANLVFPKPSVARPGSKFPIHVVSVDTATGEVVVGTKAKKK